MPQMVDRAIGVGLFGRFTNGKVEISAGENGSVQANSKARLRAEYDNYSCMHISTSSNKVNLNVDGDYLEVIV